MKRGDKKKQLEHSGLSYRAAPIGSRGPKTIDEETRSIEVVGMTEQPVMIYDWERDEYILEVLLMSGCKLPKSRQMPLLDTHSRYNTTSVIGSYREMRIEADELLGRVFYSTVPEAEGPWTKTKEGHLTDYSGGYRVNKAIFIPAGETQTVDGREWKGPLRLATAWTPKELSTCAIGADDRAKARAYNDDEEIETETQNKDNTMDEKTRKLLVSLGMPADADEDGFRDFITNLVTISEKVKDESRYSFPETEKQVDVDAERAEARKAERIRMSEIETMCREFNIPAETRSKLIDGDKSVDESRAIVMRYLMDNKTDPGTKQHVQPAVLIADEKDKFRAAAEASILLRSSVSGDHLKVEGARDLAGFSLSELARHSLRINGRPIGGDIREMVGRAMTGDDFPYILGNVAHKSLWQGWENAGETWNLWVDDSGTVSDFKTHYSPRISEFSDLEEVPELAEYKYGKRTEAQETYKVLTYGKLAGISRQAIINDDLNAITGQFMGMGEAAARKVGDLPYDVLEANADMGDGIDLFHASHSNYVGSGHGAAPGIATMDAAFLAMGTQKDLQGLRRLNIQPVYFIAPMALKGTAETFFRTDKFSDGSTNALASTRANIYSGDVLQRIYESRLDDISGSGTTGYYLAARRGRTLKMFFLNGVKTPFLEQQNQFHVDGVEYKVRMDAGCAPMDYRGLYFNYGA